MEILYDRKALRESGVASEQLTKAARALLGTVYALEGVRVLCKDLRLHREN